MSVLSGRVVVNCQGKAEPFSNRVVDICLHAGDSAVPQAWRGGHMATFFSTSQSYLSLGRMPWVCNLWREHSQAAPPALPLWTQEQQTSGVEKTTAVFSVVQPDSGVVVRVCDPKSRFLHCIATVGALAFGRHTHTGNALRIDLQASTTHISHLMLLLLSKFERQPRLTSTHCRFCRGRRQSQCFPLFGSQNWFSI